MFNCHVHTSFSSDCNMGINEAIEVLNEKKLGVIITDHMDLGLCEDGRFTFDVKEYFNEYEKYRNDRLLLGIEIGMTKDYKNENKKIALNSPFDYVLGSLHVVNGFDPFYDEYYVGKNKKEAYEEYFLCMLENIKIYDFIDCLGHIDYIARYGRFEDKEIYYDDYKDFIDEILKIVAQRDISIEINTRRLEDKVAYENLYNIYKRFKELGGKIVTIGSDSHKAIDIEKNLNEALKMIKDLKLTPVYYKNRKAVEYSI
ncbi:histidinol phosphate phosphatase [Caloramator sp. E03]|uniref:histidinol phosphate phosphatase n=1 Tax=Caloramator sp. E03 TaxID=2576307 RepID=UPI001110F211|nr:histidinol phosphate phosphatase [Caloramator sp. E03]QCX32812.1 histidinol phosphate phosphatase [Caloramator sp. E03]